MGVGSRVLHSQADYDQHYAPGHFWMTLLEGRHVSSDLAVVDGVPRWWRHVTGKPAGEGTFDYWTSTPSRTPTSKRVAAPGCARTLPAIPACSISKPSAATIIEVHLRFADQWPDLYGAGWVAAVVAALRDR